MTTKTATPATNGTAKVAPVQLAQFDRRILQVTVEGISRLVIHKFSAKALKEIEEKHQQKARLKKGERDPLAEYNDARYRMPNGKDGVPAIAFKNAMVRAANSAGLKMTEARQAFFILGDLVPIDHDREEPEMRTDMVVIGQGTSTPRYRPSYENWSVTLEIEYNASLISSDMIVNLLELAGFGVGIGEYRPERNGDWGRFRVRKEKI